MCNVNVDVESFTRLNSYGFHVFKENRESFSANNAHLIISITIQCS